MTLEEKDKYIAEHLMKLTDETLRFMVADLHAEIASLTQQLNYERGNNNFDAKRLRRLATLCGCSVPESDETMLGCAGTVIGSITRVVEMLLGRDDVPGS